MLHNDWMKKLEQAEQKILDGLVSTSELVGKRSEELDHKLFN
jgi:hypothetical protein